MVWGVREEIRAYCVVLAFFARPELGEEHFFEFGYGGGEGYTGGFDRWGTQEYSGWTSWIGTE